MRERTTEEQRRFLAGLRGSRAAAFRGEIVPHFRYVFQSGFGLFVSALFFAALAWYLDFIKAIPAEWPSGAVGAAALTLASVRAPLRTYLRPADTVFLLPMEEGVLSAYIQPSLIRAIVAAALRAVAVFCVYAPIYMDAPKTADLAGSHPVALLAALAAILSGGNVYAGWKERQCASKGWRHGLRLARWLLTGIIFALLLLKPLAIAVLLTAACMAIMALLWRLPVRHTMPWDALIEEEAAIRRRWMAFLGWFVDVPTETSKPSRRRWIAWTADRLPWRHSSAWAYLHAKVFLRGETFGALWRLIVLSGIVLAVSDNAWADGIAYVLAIFLFGLQLGELRRVRLVETAATLPLPPEGRLLAAASIARSAGILAALLLAAIGIATSGLVAGDGIAGWGGAFRLDLWLPLAAFGLLWCGWRVPRKIAAHDEEDDL
ncbi:ABC transporter permease [Cohnella suwonensis]|uniref:ABC transporter permease n=1 Tax=Cohnella suwonensis TaxID=696072 RepID=A0ABW0LXD5_9BACL